MYRAQILLRPEQHRRLLRLSEEQGKSLSEVARSLLDEALLAHQGTVWESRSRALEQLRALRDRVRHAERLPKGDLVADSRDEREVERPWQ